MTGRRTTDGKSRFNRIALIGNYLPRQCGIATFTTHLTESLATRYSGVDIFALPVNDVEEGYEYPSRVGFEIVEKELASYRRAADFLNINKVDLVCLQHEYGIFGGPQGSHILSLLRDLRMPVVTTLHTVLKQPDELQKQVMLDLAEVSDRLVVMSQKGAGFLKDIYNVPGEKIDFIHHGIPDMPFIDPNFYKDRFGVEGKLVMLTFGLLSSGKGIEFAIRALPRILEKHPNVVYIVVGATHPHVVRHEGETYRLSLQGLAKDLGVEKNVIFHNRFVSQEELEEFIGAADIYLTPYLGAEQMVSGTLAYTVGCGKAVVSTPYWYAQELLAEERGLIVPFREPEAMADATLELLDNETKRHHLRINAYRLGRQMIWHEVAGKYMASFEGSLQERGRMPRASFSARTLDKGPLELPLIKLSHLKRLTDGTGVFREAVFTSPAYGSGYRCEDNALGLSATVMLEEVEGLNTEIGDLESRYLAFLWHAFNTANGRFRSELEFDRRWRDEPGSEECHGRALLALGMAAGRSQNEGVRGLASRLFTSALPTAGQFTASRPCALTLIAIQEYMRQFFGHRSAQLMREQLAERLFGLYKKHSASDWPWFEDRLTYLNAALPHSLILAGQWIKRGEMVEAGLKTLEWLCKVQTSEDDVFSPVGNEGYYPRGGEKARFDQSPIEAQCTVAACLEAYRMTRDEFWRHEALRAFEWFLGRNDLRTRLFDPATGGCRNGLMADRIDEDQGAEATLAFLTSILEMTLAETVVVPRKE